MFESGYDDLKAHAKRNGIPEEGLQGNAMAEFSRAWRTWDRHIVSEWSSDSEVSMMSQPIDDQLRLLQQKTGDSKWYGFPEYLADQSDWTLLTSATYNYRRRKLKRADNQIRRLQKQFPGAGFQTFEQLLASAQEETRKIREDADRAGAAPGAASTFGMIGGMITGSIRDPIMAASMVFGASPIVGGTIRANAARAFKTEALIGGLSEAAIQPFVSNWKEEINNPISVKEMAMHIAFAAVGAGALRAAGSAVVDRFQISKIKKVLGEKRTLAADGDKEAGVEADILEEYLRIYQPLKGQGRQEEKAHLAKIEEAQDRMEMGIPPRADPESGDAPGRTLYEVDPREVEVDAKTFQFKEGGDVEGVTDALTGVTRWDPELANTVMIWERADGKRFIADGHQRLALAKRAIADGQNPNEVKLQAMIYREAEGFTPEMVRGKAAYRNISMGTGSVLDAAKMIRESKGRGMEGLPILPPRGRLTQAAEGLARLDDEAFQMVVNGIGDPRHAAIVGRLIDDPQAQRAAISELAKAEPGNLNQAELIVHDMNRAGFVHTETVDLFGGQEMAETLFKERAQVIDAVMKGLRKDRGLFRTLEARSSTITKAGNVLDRAGNIQRLSEDERMLQLLTSLANSKGPVSEAINQAARKVKEGATPGSTAGSLLESVKRASDGVGAGRIDDARLIEEDLTPKEAIVNPMDPSLSPEGKLAEIARLTGENQPVVDRLMQRIDQKFGTESGSSVKEAEKILEKASRPSILEKSPWHSVEHVRDTFRFKTIIEDFRDVPKIFEELLADGIRVVKIDTKKLFHPKEWGWRIISFDLRMPNGQIVEWYLPVRELEIEKKARGHLIFEEWRNKTPEELKAQEELYRTALNKSYEGYDAAFSAALDRIGISRKEAAASWTKAENSVLDALRKSSSSSGITTSAVERAFSSQVPSSARMTPGPGPVNRKTLDVPSSTKAKGSDATLNPSGEIIANDTKNIYQDMPDMGQIIQDELTQAQRILDTDPDLELPTGLVLEDGETVVNTQTLRSVFDDLDAQERAVDDLFTCTLQ